MTPLELLLSKVSAPALLNESGLNWRAATKEDRYFIYSSLQLSGQKPFILGTYLPWKRTISAQNDWNKLKEIDSIVTAVNANPAKFPGGNTVFGRVQALLDNIELPEPSMMALINKEINAFYRHVREYAFNSEDIIVLYDKEHPTVIVGWSCPEFSYLKLLFREKGLEEILTKFWHG